MDNDTKTRLALFLGFDYPTVDAMVAHLAEQLLIAPADENNNNVASHLQMQTPSEMSTGLIEPSRSRSRLLVHVSNASSNQGCGASSSSNQQPTCLTDAIKPMPADRRGATNSQVDAMSSAVFGAWVQSADQFDSEMFGLGAEEAVLADPQQRLLLRCAHGKGGAGQYQRLTTPSMSG